MKMWERKRQNVSAPIYGVQDCTETLQPTSRICLMQYFPMRTFSGHQVQTVYGCTKIATLMFSLSMTL